MHAFLILCLLALTASAAAQSPDDWRKQKRLIDLHQHISYTTQHLARTVKIMDAVGLGIGVALGSMLPTVGSLTHRAKPAVSRAARRH